MASTAAHASVSLTVQWPEQPERHAVDRDRRRFTACASPGACLDEGWLIRCTVAGSTPNFAAVLRTLRPSLRAARIRCSISGEVGRAASPRSWPAVGRRAPSLGSWRARTRRTRPSSGTYRSPRLAYMWVVSLLWTSRRPTPVRCQVGRSTSNTWFLQARGTAQASGRVPLSVCERAGQSLGHRPAPLSFCDALTEV